MTLHFNKPKKICLLTGLVWLSTAAIAEPLMDSAPHFYIALRNLSMTHSVSSVTFTANPSDSISLDNFPDINLKPREGSQPYGAHIHTKDMNSSFTLTFTGDDGKICAFTTIGHNPPTQSGDGCVGAKVIPVGQTLIFQNGELFEVTL